MDIMKLDDTTNSSKFFSADDQGICQAQGRRFETDHPLHSDSPKKQSSREIQRSRLSICSQIVTVRSSCVSLLPTGSRAQVASTTGRHAPSDDIGCNAH